MTKSQLIIQNLRYHVRSHLGVFLGAAIGSAVLIGALVVGDSVRNSLREMAMARLGRVHFSLTANDRLFREATADLLNKEIKAPSSAALMLSGSASSQGGKSRANQVHIIGIQDSFWELSRLDVKPKLVADNPGIVINRRLADQLNVSAGESILLRIEKVSSLSRDAPMAPQDDITTVLRLPISRVLPDSTIGRFSLAANQVPPFNAFVPLEQLQEKMETSGKVNLLLAGQNAAENLTMQSMQEALSKVWTLEDSELQLNDLPQGGFELRTPRVFIDESLAESIMQAIPNAAGILTYFVNEIRKDDKVVPYSMVTAMNAPLVPPGMKDNQILLNQWAADKLNVAPGDEIQLKYFIVGIMRQYEERTRIFQLHSILPMSPMVTDSDLMPDFPGLTDAESCRDWDTGLPVDLGRLGDQDQEYWNEYRGAPKAFVTLHAGLSMWNNRFGNLTAIRFDPNGKSLEESRRLIEQELNPVDTGLIFSPARETALNAGNQSMDFGGLFIGFSFFLITAALILMALLFRFGLEQRMKETGLLLALGMKKKAVRNLFLIEGSILAFLGGLIGVLGGVYYAKAMLYGLTTIWKDAVGTSSLTFSVTGTTLMIGLVSSTLIAISVIFITIRKQASLPAVQLLSESGSVEDPWEKKATWKKKDLWTGGITGIVGILIIGTSIITGNTSSPAAFFSAGALLLISGMCEISVVLNVVKSQSSLLKMSILNLGIRNAARRRTRSLATAGLLACGSFLVVSVGANRLDSSLDAELRSSGTGGFALIGETSVAISQDLNGEDGRAFFGLDDSNLQPDSIVQMRVLDGDDASCLNLNRTQKPRILGVDPLLLKSRNAFTFAKVADGFTKEQGWSILKTDADSTVIPAIGDMNSILWALGKKVGDTLDYQDAKGESFKIKIVGAVANSILQGNLLIDETAFVHRYPNQSGYRMFLVDADSNQIEETSELLSVSMEDMGMQITPTIKRLDDFNGVQNTYLSTFQILGGLGLILGSFGLGIVVLRNVLERRAEFALLKAVGFRTRMLHYLVVSEHTALLLTGLLTGVVSAVIAVIPALTSPGAQVPYRSLGLTLAAVFLSGLIWTWLASGFALKTKLLTALRNQ